MLADVRMDLGALVREAVEERFEPRIYQRDQIAHELVTSWLHAYPDSVAELELTYESRSRDAAKLGQAGALWHHVDEIISELDLALPDSAQDGHKAEAWRHQNVALLSGKKDVDNSLSLEALSRCARIYLYAKWADSPALECWIVRQMIYAETFAFSRETGIPAQLKSPGFWWNYAKSAVKWLIGVGVALAIGEQYGAGLGVLSYAAWICMIHFLARDQVKVKMDIFKLFGLMQTAYRVAMRSPAYPLEVERHIALAEDQGAIWPEGLRPLLHRAMERSPRDWSARLAY